MKYLITALALALLSGCGAVYMSPRVTDGDGKVRILELTPQTVLAANRASYSPKELPAVFFTAAGGPSAGRGIGATPSAALEPEQRPTALTLRVPPQVPMRPYTIGIGDGSIKEKLILGINFFHMGQQFSNQGRPGFTMPGKLARR